MPRYKFQAPDGSVVTVEGDSPPTPDELDKMLSGKVSGGDSRPDNPPKPSTGGIKEFVSGASKQLRLGGVATGRAVLEGGRSVADAVGSVLFPKAKPTPEVAAANEARRAHLAAVVESLAPKPDQTRAEKAGRVAEQIAEFSAVGGAMGAGRMAVPSAVTAVAGGEAGAHFGRKLGPAGEAVGGMGGAIVGGALPGGLLSGIRKLATRRPTVSAPVKSPPTPPAAGGEGVLSPTTVEALKSVQPSAERIAAQLLGQIAGQKVGIPWFIGRNIGTAVLKAVRIFNKARASSVPGAAERAESDLASELVNSVPGLTREKALEMIRTPGMELGTPGSVGARPVAGRPVTAPTRTPEQVARDAADLAAAKARMTLTPEEVAKISEEAANVRAARAPKGQRAKPAPAGSAGKPEAATTATPPQPTPPPAGVVTRTTSAAAAKAAVKSGSAVTQKGGEYTITTPAATPAAPPGVEIEAALIQRLRAMSQMPGGRDAVRAAAEQAFGPERAKEVLASIDAATSRPGTPQGGVAAPPTPKSSTTLEQALQASLKPKPGPEVPAVIPKAPKRRRPKR